jgi:hypothetical protein
LTLCSLPHSTTRATPYFRNMSIVCAIGRKSTNSRKKSKIYTAGIIPFFTSLSTVLKKAGNPLPFPPKPTENTQLGKMRAGQLRPFN